MERTDEEVWASVLAGSPADFGVVWDRHRDRVFRHLLGRGSTVPDAEELTAVAFLELWRRRTSVRFVDGSLLPWLVVTAGNVARNAQRSRNRYRAFLARLPGPEVAADPAVLVLGPDGNERTQAVWRALDTLGRLDRHLLAMTALEGFTIAESAAALGISEAAAKMRLSRLRRRLRASIDPHLGMEGGLT